MGPCLVGIEGSNICCAPSETIEARKLRARENGPEVYELVSSECETVSRTVHKKKSGGCEGTALTKADFDAASLQLTRWQAALKHSNIM